MPIARSTAAGAVSGVLLLAGAVGFGVGLPKVVDDGTASASDLPVLPDRLDDRMVALSAVTPDDAGTTSDEDAGLVQQLADAAADSDAESSENLAAQYDAAVVRAYVDVQAMAAADGTSAPAQMSVTVVPGDAGLVIPSGPFQIDQNGSHYELQEIDGYRCAVAYREAADPTTGMPTGEEVPAANYQAECRAERGGLTYDVYANGLTPEELVGYLDQVLDATA